MTIKITKGINLGKTDQEERDRDRRRGEGSVERDLVTGYEKEHIATYLAKKFLKKKEG